MKNIKQRIRNLFREIASNDGFTLIEIMIVVIIISVLAGSAVFIFRGSVEKTKRTAVERDFSTFENALEAYKLYNDTYPTSEEGLQKLIDAALLKKKKKTLLDPWSNPYQYRYPGESGDDPEIWSFGADGKPGGEGVNADIKSWEE